MPAIPSPPQVVMLLSRFVEERTGLHYGPESLELFTEKASARALDAGFETLLDYYYYLRYDARGPAELDALAEVLVVHETYFFREADALRVLAEDLAPTVRAGGRARVWCAACATGEEPLTLAMLLAGAGALAGVEIVASDISAGVLDRARRGEYGRRSLRALPHDAGRWMDVADGRAVVRDELRAAVSWHQINLLDAAAVKSLGAFDVIVCRNVLIYFSDETVQRVVGTLADALRPGGQLLVGASESLLRYGTLLSCEERGGAFFYRKGM